MCCLLPSIPSGLSLIHFQIISIPGLRYLVKMLFSKYSRHSAPFDTHVDFLMIFTSLVFHPWSKCFHYDIALDEVFNNANHSLDPPGLHFPLIHLFRLLVFNAVLQEANTI